jgi:bifunctional N-acetylglucosamine-1-phosphate-uridyltransferase/glucosamine-1-phosphate-acetyltransferase GlmU-like protein
MVFHLQLLHCHSAKQSVNCQSDLKHAIPSSELGTSKQPVEANQLNSLEQSLQAVTVSKGDAPAVSSTDIPSLIAQKKGLQSEIAELTTGIDNLKVT